MKLVLEVKNMRRAIKPTENDVLLFDGESWYITDKASILKEANSLIAECRAELANLKDENDAFKKDVASQLLEMSGIIRDIYSKEN